jgi:hypothetical protein
MLDWKLIRKANIVPAIGERWGWTTNIFFFCVVFAFDEIVRVSEDTIVSKIECKYAADEKWPK